MSLWFTIETGDFLEITGYYFNQVKYIRLK